MKSEAEIRQVYDALKRMELEGWRCSDDLLARLQLVIGLAAWVLDEPECVGDQTITKLIALGEIVGRETEERRN